MDFTTHVTVAAFTGAGLAKGKAGSKAIWAAVFFGSMAPDIDAVLYLVSPQLYSAYHRRHTHTLLGVAVLSAVTTALVAVLWCQPDFVPLYLYALAGGLVHLGLDTLTTYPLRPLAPLASHDCALGLFRWRDPFFKTVSLVGIGLVLFLPHYLARPVLLLGLVLMVGRVATAFFLRR